MALVGGGKEGLPGESGGGLAQIVGTVDEREDGEWLLVFCSQAAPRLRSPTQNSTPLNP
jgi:hypothetical protein